MKLAATLAMSEIVCIARNVERALTQCQGQNFGVPHQCSINLWF
jgi:hypothetical protein